MKITDLIKVITGYTSYADSIDASQLLAINNKNDMKEILFYGNKKIQERAERKATNSEKTIFNNNVIKEVVDFAYKISNNKTNNIFKKLVLSKGNDANYSKYQIDFLYAHWLKIIKQSQKTMLPIHALPPKVKVNLIHNGVFFSIVVDTHEELKKRYVDFFKNLNNAMVGIEEKQTSQNEELKKYLSIARNNKIYIPAKYVLHNDVIKFIEQIMYERFENLVTSEAESIDVQHSDGDDCEWIIGDKRCKCGN